MSELVWGIKNGDLDQVKDIVEKKVFTGKPKEKFGESLLIFSFSGCEFERTN